MSVLHAFRWRFPNGRVSWTYRTREDAHKYKPSIEVVALERNVDGEWVTDRPICDHGSYYVNDDGAQVCLVCGRVTNRPVGSPDD